MTKSHVLPCVLPILLTLGAGCTSEVGSPELADNAKEAVSAAPPCPASSASDDQFRAAATVAFELMKGAADQVPANDTQTSILPNVQSTSILAAQRYRIRSVGTGIEFDPGDPLYTYVTSKMKAQLAIAQLDASVAKFLSDGLTTAYKSQSGQYYPHILALPALRAFSFNGPATTHIRDSSSSDDSHYATVSSRPWCGTTDVTISQTVDESWQFAAVDFSNINMWRSAPPTSFKGSSQGVSSPFNGPSGANPYLIISIDGKTENAFSSYTFVNCWNNPGFKCTSTIDIDPIPYAVPGAYYDASGNPVGVQSNPFAIIVTSLYADASHAGQWGTRVVNGVQQWGTFSTPLNVLGTTVYQYVKNM
jgi:hypothetical protein